MSAAPLTSPSKATYEDGLGKSNVYAEEEDDHTETDASSRKVVDAESGVHRGLSTRHLSLLAIGGIIGPGLLVGTGGALSAGGPASLIAGFAIVGIIAYSIMQSLGEATTLYPAGGSFIGLADRFVSKGFSASVGYSYFFLWICVLAAEYTVICSVMVFWVPEVPLWGWFLIFFFVFLAFQMLGVAAFGEAEFWLACSKLVGLTAFYIFSIVYVAGGIKGRKLGARYWSEPGPLNNNGFGGFASVFAFCATFYAGVEAVAAASSETRNPGKSMPRAINQVLIRIVYVYMGFAIMIGLVCPADAPGLIGGATRALRSPMTIAIQNAGWEGGVHLINAFILITCLSAINSSIYIASRAMLFLAADGKAPQIFKRVNKRGVPVYAIILANACGAISMMNNSTGAAEAYSYLINVSSVCTFLVWGSISFTHIRFRRAWKAQGRTVEELPFKSFAYPYNAYFGVAANIFLALIQGWSVFAPFDAGAFVAAYIMIPVFLLIVGAWMLVGRSPFRKLEDVDLDYGRRSDLDIDEDVPGSNVQRTGIKSRVKGMWSNF